MDFNLTIAEKFRTLIALKELKVVEESKNLVRYECEMVSIRLMHNPRENSYSLWVGRKCFIEIEIDNQLMEEYYQSDLKLSDLPLATFVNNVVLFFMSYGKQLLNSNGDAIAGLKNYNMQRSYIYFHAHFKTKLRSCKHCMEK